MGEYQDIRRPVPRTYRGYTVYNKISQIMPISIESMVKVSYIKNTN